jgi:hypothetical protein
MTEKEILEAICVTAYTVQTNEGVYGIRRSVSPDKLAAFLAKHLHHAPEVIKGSAGRTTGVAVGSQGKGG